MEYFKEIKIPHTVSADPIYCFMIDGKQTHHCPHELRSACALFGKALEDENFVNKKCKECLEAPAADAVEVVRSSWKVVVEYEDHAEIECQECHMPTDSHYTGRKTVKPFLPPYCQFCGAKMSDK